jgi:hypothetical protein
MTTIEVLQACDQAVRFTSTVGLASIIGEYRPLMTILEACAMMKASGLDKKEARREGSTIFVYGDLSRKWAALYISYNNF